MEKFESNGAKGKIVVAGSSSVTPVMEKLKEAYLAVNKEAEIEVQESDSTTGMTAKQWKELVISEWHPVN